MNDEKITLYINNMFEMPPVSRAQAKSICENLDQFSEIEFDFNGVDFVSPSFAHEIFFVFANAHPGLKLTPINMNDNVRRMYVNAIVKKVNTISKTTDSQ